MPNFFNLLRARKFSTVADTALEISPHNSATPNFTIEAGGKLKWSSGSATADTNLYRASADTLKTDDNLVVEGNLTVNGTTTTVNSTVLTIDDKNIELASTASPSNTSADGGGITLRGTTDKTFNWVNATGAWTSSEDLNLLSGKVYGINGTTVLSSTALGTAVVSSSLTSVGTLTSLNAATPTFTGPLTSSGTSTFQDTVVLQQSKEKLTIDSSNINATATNVDVLSGAVYYYTGTITDGFKFNIRGNSSNTLASLLTTNTEAITIVLMIENVTTAKSFASSGYLTIDTNATVTIKWFGGSKPSGNIGTDIYTFTIYKTGTSAFTVFASQSKFA